MNELEVSQSGMDTVYEFVKLHMREDDAEASRFPSAKSIQKRIRSACDRDLDGTIIRKIFHVPAGIPGIEQQDVVLEFVDIACAITEMLLDNSIASEENWIWEAEQFVGVYGELNTGAWWRDVERRSKAKKKGFQHLPSDIVRRQSPP